MNTTSANLLSRREFVERLTQASLFFSLMPTSLFAQSEPKTLVNLSSPILKFPGPWAFQLPKSALILVSDQQLEELQDPEREVNISLSATPQIITLRRFCEQQKAAGVRTVILAFDHFWTQYRPGQGERRLRPDMDEYLDKIKKISATLRQYGLEFELSLLSPLELGTGYEEATGESGGWVQYREGIRDPHTGQYHVQLWEHRRWTNNKGTIPVQRIRIRAFAFRERRVGGTPYYRVNPSDIIELKEPAVAEVWEEAKAQAGSFLACRLNVSGKGDTQAGSLDRVLITVTYRTSEIDYFSPKAAPFLKQLVDRYHAAQIPLHGLYSDEMHIQQDWAYHSHHDEGQFTLRYLTPSLSNSFSARYGDEFRDFEKYLVYFCYGQHSFSSNLEARLSAQHVLGDDPDAIQRTFLLRRRYYELLENTVVDLFLDAKRHAETLYGHTLEARAHATWAQSPTIDSWETGGLAHPIRQYEYTSDFVWSNTVQQAASACSNYFKWNEFLTGGGNDHTEGGWSDRNYYALALACSTGILNEVPYAYAAHWGMPAAVAERRQALVDAYGAAASGPFQAIQDSQHRDIEVLMLYPSSLVAVEERYGSWMVQYGYANYVTAEALLARGKVLKGGSIELAGRRFGTIAVLFEPMPPDGLLTFLDQFVQEGGRLIWSGPPPRLNFGGNPILDPWKQLFGVEQTNFGLQGMAAPGQKIAFEGPLQGVPAQTILTHFLVDHLYPVQPAPQAQVAARWGGRVIGTHRQFPSSGSTTYLGFRPRDDQAASLGEEVRTWFEILQALGAYPATAPGVTPSDNPSVVSRQSPYLACRFPNGTVALAVHYRHHLESWPGGFHRDAREDEAVLARNPLPPDSLKLEGLRIQGHQVTYQGRLLVAFRTEANQPLLAFGGYQCQEIQLDGRRFEFANRPLGFVAWAPVAPDRRIAGGAVLELWIQGDAEVRIPWPSGKGRLVAAGPQPGSRGGELPCALKDGLLIFQASPARIQGHLYLVED